VSDLEAVEAALRESERHLAAAQRITHCGSWELDLGDLVDLDRNRLRWSDEVFRIFGYEPGTIEVTNANFFRAVHPDDRDRIGAAVRAAIERGTVYSLDHRVIRPDGSVRIVHEQSEIQLDGSGRPLRMIGTVQDVTEQRTAESQLMLRDRLVSVGSLAAGVAHEINNPLATVCVNLELMAAAITGIEPRGELESYLSDARDGAERVRVIIRDLMVFLRADDTRRAPTDVTTVLESALRMVSHEIKHRARVIRDYGDVPLVETNEARLAQVFVNLMTNAAHSIPEGDPDHHQIRLRCSTDAAGCGVVSISDTGRGIPPDQQSRIFTPFFTTKLAGEGAGLGLSICRRIVMELGGEIEFTSEPGRGTEFRVTLPAAQGRSLPGVTRTARSRTHIRRLLIIDDEILLTSALRNTLCDDHEVSVLNDAIEARDALVAGARFDVILCDLIMPRMSGMELYAHLLQVSPDQAARMILMTGDASSEAARDFLATSGVRSIDKPFELDALRRLFDGIPERA